MTAELLNQLTPSLAQSPERRFPGHPSAEMLYFHCDLSNGNSFVPERCVPPLAILSAFGDHPIHIRKKIGSWDLERAAADHSDSLIGSLRMDRPAVRSEGLEDVIIEFGERTSLCGDASRIMPRQHIGFGG